MYKERYNTWLQKVTDEEKQELLLIKENEKEIEERFSLDLSFGTAGMRGEVGMGTFRMNVYTVRRAAFGLAEYISSLGDTAKARGVVVSYDTRRFSKEFSLAVCEVLAFYKINSFLFEDVRPVPVCSYAIRELNAAAGVMITASHNPKEYNGFKVYGEDGAQMSPEPTQIVVNYITSTNDYFSLPYEKVVPSKPIKGLDNEKIHPYITVIGKSLDEKYYQEIEKLSVSPEVTKSFGKNIKLVYTPVHGAGYVPVTEIFKRLGINVSVVESQKNPDTEFSTVKVPNPENSDTLRLGMELGDKIGADVVLATDPDCDRLGVAIRDNKNNFFLLTGNQIAVLLLDYILFASKERGELPKDGAIVKSIVTTTLADRLAASYGIETYNVLTGFKFIGEKIKEWEENKAHTFIFGFEESFGTLKGTHARDKDAVVGSMLFAEMTIYYESKGESVFGRLQKIYQKFGYYTELNEAITYKGLDGMEKMASVMKKVRSSRLSYIGEEKVLNTYDYLLKTKTSLSGKISDSGLPSSDAVYYELKDNQFVCIRPSGTEPKLKTYVLVFDKDTVSSQNKAEKTMAAIKKELE